MDFIINIIMAFTSSVAHPRHSVSTNLGGSYGNCFRIMQLIAFRTSGSRVCIYSQSQ